MLAGSQSQGTWPSSAGQASCDPLIAARDVRLSWRCGAQALRRAANALARLQVRVRGFERGFGTRVSGPVASPTSGRQADSHTTMLHAHSERYVPLQSWLLGRRFFAPYQSGRRAACHVQNVVVPGLVEALQQGPAGAVHRGVAVPGQPPLLLPAEAVALPPPLAGAPAVEAAAGEAAPRQGLAGEGAAGAGPGPAAGGAPGQPGARDAPAPDVNQVCLARRPRHACPRPRSPRPSPARRLWSPNTPRHPSPLTPRHTALAKLQLSAPSYSVHTHSFPPAAAAPRSRSAEAAGGKCCRGGAGGTARARLPRSCLGPR
jgi:hypothetical protein